LLDNSWIELAISAAELDEQFGEDGGFAALIKNSKSPRIRSDLR